MTDQQMTFAFRLRTRIKSRLSDTNFPTTLALPGFAPIEVRYEKEMQQCAADETKSCHSDAGVRPDGGRYIFIGRHFVNEADALDSGRKFRDILLATGAQKHMGVDVGFERSSVKFGAGFHDAVRKQSGKELRGDMIGLMTYEEGSVLIARMEATLSVKSPLAQFQKKLEQIAQDGGVLNERQRTCAALLNDSHFAVQDEAIFVLLISAVEALCDQKDLPQTYSDAVQSLQDHLTGLTLDSVVRRSLENTLAYAKKQSLRQAYLKR